MSRQPRYALCGIPQHVVQRGNNRNITFFTEQDYSFYLECLRDACDKHGADVHAYVLMANHVHLLMTPSQSSAIAKVMQSVGRRYVRYINDTYQRSGTLWEGRYKASLIDSVQYLLSCYRYIELNPVRANMVTRPGDYCWSSYRYHASGHPNFLIHDHAQFLKLGRTDMERQRVYRDLFHGHMDAAIITDIRTTTNQCLVLGSERFKDQIEQALSRRVRHSRAGRPKKEIAV